MMIQLFNNDKYVYSVDMMFAYINIFKPKYEMIDVSTLSNNFTYYTWGDYTVNDVIEDPTNKLYKSDINRIKKADLN